nr:DUF3606 domain-containing protein [uncultured Caldimonas sp.]
MERRATSSGEPDWIDASNEAEMRRWAEKLSVSVETLHRAVQQAGTNAQRVGEYLLRERTDDHRVPGR